jgi:hypothetical protein
MYLSVIIRHILISSLNRSKIFILRSFCSLSLNMIWLDQNPTITAYNFLQIYIIASKYVYYMILQSKHEYEYSTILILHKI